MFRKLVSNLPFSPGLLPQVSFYARRISQENTVRRLGLVFAGLTIVMQSLFIFSPPTPSLAGSENDLIYGGLRVNGSDVSHQEAVNLVIKNVYSSTGDTNGLKALFKHYGVTEAMVRNSKTTYVCSQKVNRTVNGVDCNKDAYSNIRSIGRQTKSTQDVKIEPDGTNKIFYHRPLSIFDKINPVNTYKVLELPDQRYIMYSCGNLAFSELPAAKIVNKKKLVNGKSVYKVGENITYEVSVENTGNVAASDIRITDNINSNLKALKATLGGKIQNKSDGSQAVAWSINALAPGEVFKGQLTVKLLTAGKDACNKSYATYNAGNGSKLRSDSINICSSTEEDPEPEPPTPEPVCTALSISDASDKVFIPTPLRFSPILDSDGVQVRSYEYFINDVSLGSQTNKELDYTFEEIKDYNVSVKVTFADGTVTEKADCLVAFRATEEPNEEVDTAKAARVVTSFNPVEANENDARSTDASNQTVKANELIEFTVTATNTGNVDIKNYSLPTDDLRDVLEYADVVARDNSITSNYTDSIELKGGGVLSEGLITWGNVESLRVGETITKTFFVKVKSIIPSTNTPPSDPLSYDCVMTNVYENNVDIKVDCSSEKQIVTSTTSLPRTGPLEVAITTLFLFFVSIYLYLRNKQLVNELKIIKTEYAGSYS